MLPKCLTCKVELKDYRSKSCNRHSNKRRGWNHSEETKRKMSESRKGNLNPTFGKHWKLSDKTKKNMSLVKIGEKNPSWKGGKYRNKHGNSTYIKWRTAIFERDDYRCFDCGNKSESGNPVYLEGHHIYQWSKYPRLRFDINNGITLCRECHKLTNNYKNKQYASTF